MGGLPERTSVDVNSASTVEMREHDLIRRVQAGEKQLFYELVKPYERRVYSAAFAILPTGAKFLPRSWNAKRSVRSWPRP